MASAYSIWVKDKKSLKGLLKKKRSKLSSSSSSSSFGGASSYVSSGSDGGGSGSGSSVGPPATSTITTASMSNISRAPSSSSEGEAERSMRIPSYTGARASIGGGRRLDPMDILTKPHCTPPATRQHDTDRILLYVQPDRRSRIVQEVYDSCEAITCSDHKCVLP